MAISSDCSSGDANASLTYPQYACLLKRGDFLLVGNRPCKILTVHTSSPGCHGPAKVHFTCADIFTGKHCDDLYPGDSRVEQPFVKKVDHMVTFISDDGFLSLMDNDGNIREDLRLPTYPEGLADEINQAYAKSNEDSSELNLTVLVSMGIERVIGIRA